MWFFLLLELWQAMDACTLPKMSQLPPQLEQMAFAFALADARMPDMPIVFASDSFYKLTGYTAGEVCMCARFG
jgi:hypothetical protein